MKKFTLFTFLFALTNLFSQITITSTSIVQAGKKAIQHLDTNVLPVQTGGTNKTWDFSNLESSETPDTLSFFNKDWFPQFNSYFTNANMIFTSSEEVDNWSFINRSANKLEFVGNVQDTGDMEYEAYPFNFTIINFPMTYNSSYNSTTSTFAYSNYVGIDPDGPGPAPSIDSVRAFSDNMINEKGIGWGKIKIPTQTDLIDVIMIEKENINKIRYQAYVNSTWIDLTQQYMTFLGLDDYSDTFYDHSFWSNNTDYGFPVVSYTFDRGETNTTEIDFLNGPLPSSNINIFEKTEISIFPNPSKNSIQFSNLPQGNNNLKIFNTQGQVVYSFQMENNIIDLSFLNAGTYFISIENAGNIYNVSIVKE